MMARIIFLRLGTEERIPLSTFVDSLKNFLNVLEDLDAAISHDPRGTTIWEVAVLEKRSPIVVGALPRPKRGATDISEVVEEQLIENASRLSFTGERTEYLSDAALKKIERLATKTKKIGPLAVFLNGTGQVQSQSLITEQTLENVRKLTRVKYSAYGSVVGSLDAISVHKGNEFRIWDEATNKAIRCVFNDEDLEKVKTLLRRKVTVSGIIHANSAGIPVWISVEELESTQQKMLPTIEEMSGLVEDFTAGQPLKEYLRELSDE
jgi:hypothetical protein